MVYTTFDSPYGVITLAADESSLRELHLPGDRYFAGVPAAWVRADDDLILQQAQHELSEYFAGRRHSFAVPVRPRGTIFQEQVWQTLRVIPPGDTATYAEIAAAIGRPSAARAVGTAIGRNPICIIVPCHRVVPSSGGLGGYVAGLAFKQSLLALEANMDS